MNKVPKVRFPEFTEEWRKRKIREISTLKGGYAFKSNKFLNVKSKYQVVKMGNVYQNNLLLDKNPSYLSEITEKEKEYLLEKGDILITLTGTVGKRDFGYSYQITTEKNLLLNQRLALFKVKDDTTNDRFLRYFILKDQFLDQFFESSTGGTGNQANVSIKNVEEFSVTIPSLLEQEKIASFLSEVDKSIEALEQEKELFEQYKKGMMQKIFSQKLRFKDENGNDYPEWKEEELGKFAEINPKNEELPDKFIYIDLESVENGILKNENIILKEEAPSRAQRILKNGDILYQTVRPYQKNNLYFNKKNEIYPYIASTGYAQIRTSQDSKYLYHFIHTDRFVDSVLERCTGTSYPAINSTDLKTMKINFPSLPEQKKIASFLSAIDEKIELLGKDLEGVKEFKKGLLQNMFV